MRTDIDLKHEVIEVLLTTFGPLDTERFITSIKNNSFDYTEWQKNLWENKTIEEIHTMAIDFEKRKNKE